MSDAPELINVLVTAIADDEPVDWNAASARSLSVADRDILRQLKAISAVAAARRTDLGPESTPMSPPLAFAYSAILWVTCAKLLLAALGAHEALRSSTPPPWGVTVNALTFGAMGAWLLVRGAKDARVRSLAALFVIIASAFVNPLLPASGVLGLAASPARHLPTDAFVGVALWSFVRAFPRVSPRRRMRRVADTFVVLSAAVGLVLLTANLLLAWSAFASGPAPLHRALALLDRRAPALAYWPLLLLVSLPAIPYVVWKWRHDSVGERRRIAVFVIGLAVGLTPIFVVAMASPFVPAFADPAWQRPIGVVVYAALLWIVPSTIYAVLVQRVMDLHSIARRAMEYALARYIVWLAAVGPSIYLLGEIYVYRDLTVTQFFASRTSMMLLVLSLVGISALTFRYQLLRAVDRWFLRDVADHAEVLARLEVGLRGARSIHDIATLMASAISRAMHPRDVTIFVAEDGSDEFVPIVGEAPPLGERSALVDLLRSVRTDVQLHHLDSPIMRTLPPEDRDWVIEASVDTLFPLVGATDTLIGLVVLTPSQSGMPYTTSDRTFVTAMSGQIALRLENRRLRQAPAEGSGINASRRPTVDWQSEPATCCPACQQVWPPNTRRCTCHAVTETTALPLVVNGKFRLERLLGSGGMGVVYLAVDLTLDRRVAIKTLPTMSAAHSRRLRREAKAMASVLHPNLALIFGTEEWRDTPVIIVEYLEGGTLAERLKRGPLEIGEAIDVGVLLADVLDRVHGSGVLHRDVKPSNIGYTRDGVPKLLDFGLAAVLDRTKESGPPLAGATSGAIPPELLDDWQPTMTITISQQIVGTPLYLAPEALLGQPPQPSFDTWALSLTLYEAIAGRHPLSDNRTAAVLDRIRRTPIADIRQFRSDCPPEVADLLLSALALDIARRPPTAAALRDRLQWVRAALDQRSL